MLTLKLLADVLAIAVFGSATAGLFSIFYQGHEPTRELVAAIFWTVIAIQAATALGRFSMAPLYPGNGPYLRGGQCVFVADSEVQPPEIEAAS